MKVITSPSTYFSGTVTLKEPFTLEQVELIEAGLQAPDGLKAETEADKIIFHTAFDKLKMPALFACVEKWELANCSEHPTLNDFPFTPRPESHKLIEWLFNAIRDIYIGESKVPNE